MTLAGVAVALPATAQARTKTVDMGTPTKSAKQFQKYASDVNDFFPHRLTIRVGDKVRFRPVGFHNVDIPAKGEDPLPFAAPTGQLTAGVNDAAGAPFWFNGQPVLGFNPALLQAQFGKRLSYNGRKRVQSGLPLAPNPKPMTVRFKRAGTITYFCDLHAGMTGVIKVKKRGARVPTAKQDARTVRKQVKRDLKIAKGLAAHKPPAGTVDVGEAGPHGVEYFGMLPGSVTVPVGTTLRFRMSPGSFEAHTATFGPGPIEDPNSYLGAIQKSFESVPFDSRGVYSSEPPATVGTLTPKTHGNGFWNSGALDRSNASPLPDSSSVKFGAPGTYTYYCLIHPFMKGQIVVQ